MCVRVNTCCGCWDLETGSRIIASVQIVLGITALVGGFAQAAWTGGASGLVTLLLGVLLYFGTERRSRPFVLTWLIVILVFVVLEVCDVARVVVALSGTLAAIHDEDDDDDKEHVLALHRLLVTAAIVAFTAAIDLYFWIVVHSFYRQLKEEEEATQPLSQPDV